MSIWDMANRTKTYIAGDWDGDKDAINQLHTWNNSKYWGLKFVDVHEFTSSHDSSLNCNIKKSLRQRMSISKTFILIVGEHTKNLRSGACYECSSYNSCTKSCARGYSVDNRSYVDYECYLASSTFHGIKIVVLYNSTKVDRDLCPDAVRYLGKHVAMKHVTFLTSDWDYKAVKDAIDS